MFSVRSESLFWKRPVYKSPNKIDYSHFFIFFYYFFIYKETFIYSHDFTVSSKCPLHSQLCCTQFVSTPTRWHKKIHLRFVSVFSFLLSLSIYLHNKIYFVGLIYHSLACYAVSCVLVLAFIRKEKKQVKKSFLN